MEYDQLQYCKQGPFVRSGSENLAAKGLPTFFPNRMLECLHAVGPFAVVVSVSRSLRVLVASVGVLAAR